MDALELLKKDWEKRGAAEKTVTKSDIYKMIHRKSSSVVKWILLVSIAEFLLWLVLGVVSLFMESSKLLAEIFGTSFYIISALNYLIVIGFIYTFFRNYKKISTTDTTYDLMRSILRTRKTVQYYVLYNLGMFAVTFIYSVIVISNNLNRIIPNYKELEESFGRGAIRSEIILVYIILGIVSLLFLLLFYWILYGLFLKRLRKNYKILSDSEI